MQAFLLSWKPWFTVFMLCVAFLELRLELRILTGDAGVPAARHPHQSLFPLLRKPFAYSRFYLWVLAFTLPALWGLSVYAGMKPWIATILYLSLFFGPTATHIDQRPNGDMLTTLVLAVLVHVIYMWPTVYWAHSLVFFIAMLGHERSIVLVPGLIAWGYYCRTL